MPKTAIELRLARTAKGWVLDDLATRVHCSVPMLSLIESGRRRPTPELAARLAKALNLEVSDLFPLEVSRDRAAAGTHTR